MVTYKYIDGKTLKTSDGTISTDDLVTKDYLTSALSSYVTLTTQQTITTNLKTFRTVGTHGTFALENSSSAAAFMSWHDYSATSTRKWYLGQESRANWDLFVIGGCKYIKCPDLVTPTNDNYLTPKNYVDTQVNNLNTTLSAVIALKSNALTSVELTCTNISTISNPYTKILTCVLPDDVALPIYVESTSGDRFMVQGWTDTTIYVHYQSSITNSSTFILHYIPTN